MKYRVRVSNEEMNYQGFSVDYKGLKLTVKPIHINSFIELPGQPIGTRLTTDYEIEVEVDMLVHGSEAA